MLVRRIARPLLSAVFISGGIDTLRNPTQKAKAAGSLIDKSTRSFPTSIAEKIPADPETVVKINAAVHIGGGILLATGKAPRLASLALAGSLVPTTLAGHAFWNETDPATKAAQRTQFLKNLGLLGGLLIAAVDTEGKPSLGWRGRRAVRRAQSTVVAALPITSGHDTNGPDLGPALAAASERARVIAEEAAEHGSDLLDFARDRGTEFAKVAADRGAEWTDLAKERGAEWVGIAKERGPELAEIARERGSEWASTAADRGEVLGKRARAQAEAALEKARATRDELAR